MEAVPETSAAEVPRWSARALMLAWSVPVALGVPLTIFSLGAGGQQVPFWRMLLIVGATWYVWAAMTPFIVRLADRRRLERPLSARTVATHLVAALSACAVQALTAAVATQTLAPSPGAAFGAVFVYWLLLLVPAGVVVYAAVVGLRTAEVNRATAAERERQAQALAAQLTEARLAALRAQIQPHFLFNTLNAVIALIRDGENRRAVEGLTTLGALLRTALRSGATHEVTLGEELAFTANYLAIEQMRFGERLEVRVDVPEPLRDTRVPSLLLQPFVENALRHGLRHQPDGGRVEISARAAGDRLEVRVEDDGAGLAADWEARCAEGFGVANSRARLRQLHGAAALLELVPRAGARGTLVRIALPLRRAPAPA